MSVYVDDLVRWVERGPFGQGSCYMTADTLEELHALARRIGLRRSWFQRSEIAPHYVLTPARRVAAIRAGAVEMSLREQRARGVGSTKAFGGTLPDYEEQV